MRKAKKCAKNIRIKKTLVLLFIIFELIFTAITGPFMVYYGPFENVKNTIVSSAMTSLKTQWIATLFLSDESINQIMNKQKVSSIVQDNLNGVNVKSIGDNNIERYDVKGNKFKGYALIIKDPTRIRVGYSSMLGKEGQLTSDIAKDNNAIAAINGGAFKDVSNGSKWAGTGANPTGIIMSKGKTIFDDIKNNNVKTNIVAFTKSGKLLVGSHSIFQMKTFGVTEAVSFGPALIVNGQKTINKGDGGWGIAGRTAIAQRKDGAIILLVIDGRQVNSLGATLKEVQNELFKLGAYNATNLDGGSSSTLYYDEEVINSPSDSLGERSVPSIIYVENR